MATPFLKLNDATHPCVSINNVKHPIPPNDEIAAADIIYVSPCTFDLNGTLTPMVCVYVAQNNTTPIPYVFNVDNLADFLTFLSGLTVTNTLVTYTQLKKLNGNVNHGAASTLPSVLANTNLIIERGYSTQANLTTISLTSGSKTYPNTVLTLLGNQTTAGASATASLAVPIAASPANTDTITAYLVPPVGSPVLVGAYTVTGSPSQATVKTAVDNLFNSNILGFTFAGTLSTNVDTLAGTAPTKGAFYNGYIVRFVPTGTTFGGSTVNATFSGGV